MANNERIQFIQDEKGFYVPVISVSQENGSQESNNSQKSNPDTGYGKGNRKKSRGGNSGFINK